MRTTYRLPSGKYTKSESRYCREWRKLGRDVCSILPKGARVYAFDPGLAIALPNNRGISVDLVLAKAIQTLIQNSEPGP